MTFVDWTPLGTATARFAAAGRKWAAPAGEPLPARGADPAGAADAVATLEDRYLAWELARLAEPLEPDERRALAYLVLAVRVAVANGSTRVPVRGAAGDLAAAMAAVGASPADAAVAAALVASPDRARPVLGTADDHRPLVVDGDWLYPHRLRALEIDFVARVAPRLGKRPLPGADAAVADVVARPPVIAGAPVVLSDEQRVAVAAALERPLAVITGGPGTGKTSIIVAIVRALVRAGIAPEAIALAAPTGKAANRMDESVTAALAAIADPAVADERLAARRPRARTLHRLLGYSPGRDRFAHHAASPVDCDVAIVDEGSMIDLAMMDRLVAALRPDARLVVLGDADQLPSVDAGAVFRDLADTAAAVRLTHSYRMDAADPAGAAVLRFAQAVRAGDADPPAVRRRAARVAFRGAERVADRDREALLDRWYRERIVAPGFEARARKVYLRGPDGLDERDRADLDALFAASRRGRILAVTHEAPRTGADWINAYFHRRILDDFGGAIHGATALYPGEPVMVLRNDYERGLFNGDQGIVLRVADAGRRSHQFAAVFERDGKYVAYPLDALRSHVALAFAITVHKAQGSEFDEVVVVLPERAMPLATRELVYTAVTRARRSAVVVGSGEVLAAAAQRGIRRFSGVAERLAAVTGGGRG